MSASRFASAADCCAHIVLDVHLEMTFHLRSKFTLAAVLRKKSAKSHKPSTQLPHNYPAIQTALRTGHYIIVFVTQRHMGSTRMPTRRT